MTELETYFYETIKKLQLVSQSALHAGGEEDKLKLIDRLCQQAKTEYESRASAPTGPGGIQYRGG